MRVCLYCNEYPPAPSGGIGTMTRDLAEGLAAEGHDVTVAGVALRLPIKQRSDEQQNGVRIVRLPRASVYLPQPIRTLWHHWCARREIRRLHREKPFELIEAPDYQGWLSSGPPKRTPLVVRIHGANFFFDTELKRPGNKYEHRCELAQLRKATHLVASSQYAATRHLELARMPGRKCEMIPHAIDAAFFCPQEEVQPEPGLILFVNSLNPKKGIEELIDAANDLLPRNPQARLAIVGGDNMHSMKGTYLEQLKERVAPEIRERVEFVGRLPREQVRDWMRRAAVCVFPSHMETFGIAPAEAMAVARPVIYSRLGPGPELIEHEVTGLLCDPHDSKDIARLIEQVLGDPALANRLGTAAREKILNFCDARKWIETNIRFYERCIEESKRAAR